MRKSGKNWLEKILLSTTLAIGGCGTALPQIGNGSGGKVTVKEYENSYGFTIPQNLADSKIQDGFEEAAQSLATSIVFDFGLHASGIGSVISFINSIPSVGYAPQKCKTFVKTPDSNDWAQNITICSDEKFLVGVAYDPGFNQEGTWQPLHQREGLSIERTDMNTGRKLEEKLKILGANEEPEKYAPPNFYVIKEPISVETHLEELGISSLPISTRKLAMGVNECGNFNNSQATIRILYDDPLNCPSGESTQTPTQDNFSNIPGCLYTGIGHSEIETLLEKERIDYIEGDNAFISISFDQKGRPMSYDRTVGDFVPLRIGYTGENNGTNFTIKRLKGNNNMVNVKSDISLYLPQIDLTLSGTGNETYEYNPNTDKLQVTINMTMSTNLQEGLFEYETSVAGLTDCSPFD